MILTQQAIWDKHCPRYHKTPNLVTGRAITADILVEVFGAKKVDDKMVEKVTSLWADGYDPTDFQRFKRFLLPSPAMTTVTNRVYYRSDCEKEPLAQEFPATTSNKDAYLFHDIFRDLFWNRADIIALFNRETCAHLKRVCHLSYKMTVELLLKFGDIIKMPSYFREVFTIKTIHIPRLEIYEFPRLERVVTQSMRFWSPGCSSDEIGRQIMGERYIDYSSRDYSWNSPICLVSYHYPGAEVARKFTHDRRDFKIFSLSHNDIVRNEYMGPFRLVAMTEFEVERPYNSTRQHTLKMVIVIDSGETDLIDDEFLEKREIYDSEYVPIPERRGYCGILSQDSALKTIDEFCCHGEILKCVSDIENNFYVDVESDVRATVIARVSESCMQAMMTEAEVTDALLRLFRMFGTVLPK